jgi:hypothetical protein
MGREIGKGEGCEDEVVNLLGKTLWGNPFKPLCRKPLLGSPVNLQLHTK